LNEVERTIALNIVSIAAIPEIVGIRNAKIGRKTITKDTLNIKENIPKEKVREESLNLCMRQLEHVFSGTSEASVRR